VIVRRFDTGGPVSNEIGDRRVLSPVMVIIG